MKKKFCKECDYQGYKVVDDRNACFAEVIACPSCSFGLCPECQGEKFIEKKDDQGYMSLELCNCQQLKTKMSLFNRAKIPNRFTRNLQKENFREAFLKEAFAKSLEFVESFNPQAKGIIFSGVIGCGKTTLVSAIAQQITLQKGYSCLFFEFTMLLEEIRDTYSQQKSEMEILDKICANDLVIVDEIGKGKNSEWEIGIIESLVNRRYNNNQTMLFTTNFTFSGKKDNLLKNRITARTYSRIQEMCDFITIEGKDLRLKHLNKIVSGTSKEEGFGIIDDTEKDSDTISL